MPCVILVLNWMGQSGIRLTKTCAIHLLVFALFSTTVKAASSSGGSNETAAGAELSQDYPLAIQLYSEALAKDSSNLASRGGRARSYYILHDFDSASNDFSHVLAHEPHNEYAMIWLYLSQARNGKMDRGKLITESKGSPPKVWPYAIISYLAGRTEWEDMFNTALAIKGDAGIKARCEAAFFYGESELAEGNAKSAMGGFELAMAPRCHLVETIRSMAGYEYQTLYQAGFRPQPVA